MCKPAICCIVRLDERRVKPSNLVYISNAARAQFHTPLAKKPCSQNEWLVLQKHGGQYHTQKYVCVCRARLLCAGFFFFFFYGHEGLTAGVPLVPQMRSSVCVSGVSFPCTMVHPCKHQTGRHIQKRRCFEFNFLPVFDE